VTLGVRSKLFLASLLVIVCVGGASAAFLESELRGLLEARIQAEVVRQARSSQAVVELVASSGKAQDMDRLADRLATDKYRVTIIALDGTVLGDSRLDGAALQAADNHAERHEVVAALRDGVGIAKRGSATIGTPLLYAAFPYSRDGQRRGTVRVALPLTDVDAALADLEALLLLAGGLGLAVAVFMSGLASELMSRALRDLVDHARAIVEGAGAGPLPARRGDELRRLRGSFQLVAEELDVAMSRLARERDRFETILASMREAVLALDDQGVVTMANPAVLELFDLDEKPTGKPLLDAIDAPALHASVERARDGIGGSDEFGLSGETKRKVLAVTAPLRTTGGAVVVMHDVTNMRRLETVRRDFVANVSHELRTPVSVVSANAETLLSGALDDEQRAREFVAAIQRNAERLTALLDDLLDLSRIEAGRYKIKPELLLVSDVVDRACDAVADRAGAQGIAIDLKVPDDLSARADPGGLDQILTNLLDNAVKYTPEDGRVTVRASPAMRTVTTKKGKVKRKKGVRIEVEDDGPGVAPEHRERVFERFYRVDEGRARREGGTGLGLAICRHLAEEMDGAVGVEPAAEQGAVFWVELPA
jgi:two-component system phosphate regulon sensor histidine kinase PhoR